MYFIPWNGISNKSTSNVFFMIICMNMIKVYIVLYRWNIYLVIFYTSGSFFILSLTWHKVLILHSAEEDNLSHFDLNIACLCQSIEINNNKHVYRQSQVRKSTDSGVKWAECSLIIGAGCRVQVFSLILDSSVGLSTGIQSAGDLVSETLGSNPAFSKWYKVLAIDLTNFTI